MEFVAAFGGAAFGSLLFLGFAWTAEKIARRRLEAEMIETCPTCHWERWDPDVEPDAESRSD